MQNACLEHSNFLTVKGTILNDRVNKDQPLNSNEIGCVSAENRSKLDNNTTRRNPTTSFLTATTLIYAIGAGITAAAGTRLALQWVLDKKFNLFSFQLPDPKRSGIVIFCHYLPESGLGNLRAWPSLDVVAVSQAPSPESNPDSPLPVNAWLSTT